MLLQNFYIPFSIHCAFQNMQAAHIVCTYEPHANAFELKADDMMKAL